MGRQARQFDPEIIRAGGRTSKVIFTVRCSKCPQTTTFESRTVLTDDVVSKKLKQWGWLLGRHGRSDDICPRCLGAADENAIANKFKVTRQGGSFMAPAQLSEPVFMKNEKPKLNVDDILERHLGNSSRAKPRQSAEASQVFSRPTPSHRPDRQSERKHREGKTFGPEPSAGHRSATMDQAPPHQSAQDQQRSDAVLDQIGMDLENMRAAMQLMAEQIGRIVSLQNEQMSIHKHEADLQKQQIEAVARLAPLVARSQEVITSSVREAVSSIHDLKESTGALRGADAQEAHLRPVSPTIDAVEDEAPVRRSRGRPRKVRPEAQTETAATALPMSPPAEDIVFRRPRGRPRKEARIDTLAVVAPASLAEPIAKRPRGRPRKAVSAHGAVNPVAVASPELSVELAAKRPRGRPRKVIDAEPAAAAPVSAPVIPAGPVVRRPRGRPRKVALAPDHANTLHPAPVTSVDLIAKRPRGRPRKDAAADPAIAPAIQPAGASAGALPLKRGRGRPRKNLLGPAPAFPGEVSEGVPAAAADQEVVRGRGRPKRQPIAGSDPAGLRDAVVGWDAKTWSQQVLVYSLPDRKAPKKFVTVIQIDRDVWNAAGFSSSERLEVDRDDLELLVRRSETGVKARKIGAEAVLIHVPNIGNLNMKQVKVATDDGVMLLRGLKV